MNALKTIFTMALLFGAVTFSFAQDLQLKKVGKKFGYENSKGKMVIKAIYDNAEEFSDGWAKVNLGAVESDIIGLLDGNWGVINHLGEIIVPIEYDGVNYYADQKLFQAMKDNKAYFYNKKGKLVKVQDYQMFLDLEGL